MSLKHPVVVALTGASGVMYGVRLIQALAELKQAMYVLVSDPARKVMEVETSLTTGQLSSKNFLQHLLDKKTLDYVRTFDYKDVSALPASGSSMTAGMVIAPCSGATLSSVAHGSSRDLIERAAEVTMKEGRRLILMVRETPLSAVYLENMLKLARLGVHMLPAMPAFYQRPKTIKDLQDFMVGRVLNLLGMEQKLFPGWKGK